MAVAAQIEKFTLDDLTILRGELMKSRVDSWQAAELISRFLAGRGYGVNAKAALTVAPGMAGLRHSHETMQLLLETVAYVM